MDPDLEMYPDSAFQVNPDTDPDQIRIQGFDDQKFKKKIQQKIFLNLFFFYQKLQFTILIPRPL